MKRDRIIVTIGVAFIAILLFIIWLLASNSFVVASPIASVKALCSGFTEGWIYPHLKSTLTVLLMTYVISFIIGIGGGVILGVSSFLREVFEMIILSLYAVPKIILYPVLLTLFGIGSTTLIVMGVIHAIFPLLINTMTGIKDMSKTYIKVGKSYNANSFQMLKKIYIPAISLPLVTGLKMACSLGIIGVILGEIFASKEGMGQIIMRSYALMELDKMYGLILLLFLLAFMINILFWWLERRLKKVF